MSTAVQQTLSVRTVREYWTEWTYYPADEETAKPLEQDGTASKPDDQACPAGTDRTLTAQV